MILLMLPIFNIPKSPQTNLLNPLIMVMLLLICLYTLNNLISFQNLNLNLHHNLRNEKTNNKF